MKTKISKLNLFIKFIIAIPVVMAVLFWPAGTLNWTEAWIYLIIQFGFSGIYTIYFLKHDPQLIQKRMEMKMPPALIDKIIMIPFSITATAVLIVPGFDVIRYQWSSLPIYVEVIGFVGFLVCSYFLFLVMKENSYLAKVVEVQKDHKVISTGLYKYIRHPMYAVVIPMFFFIALALGSLYALIPAVLTAIFLIIRIPFEEKTLIKDLKGYKEYTKKTKYRLIPKIW